MQSPTTPLEVTYLRVTSLKPVPRDPRVHTDKQVRQIAQSIESFGFNVPLLIDDQQKVIAGHGRLMAARRLGWDTVPAIRRPDSQATDERRDKGNNSGMRMYVDAYRQASERADFLLFR
jgi:ParB-like chromosome segregation protein Spo0J